jgi:hypothetical protein
LVWTLVIIVLPLLGLALWFYLGPRGKGASVCQSIATTSMVRSVPTFCSVEYIARQSSDNPDLIFLSFILYSTSQHEHFGI